MEVQKQFEKICLRAKTIIHFKGRCQQNHETPKQPQLRWLMGRRRTSNSGNTPEN